MQTFIGSVVWYKILNCKLLTWSEKETFNEQGQRLDYTVEELLGGGGRTP